MAITTAKKGETMEEKVVIVRLWKYEQGERKRRGRWVEIAELTRKEGIAVDFPFPEVRLDEGERYKINCRRGGRWWEHSIEFHVEDGKRVLGRPMEIGKREKGGEIG